MYLAVPLVVPAAKLPNRGLREAPRFAALQQDREHAASIILPLEPPSTLEAIYSYLIHPHATKFFLLLGLVGDLAFSSWDPVFPAIPQGP